jgi:uncharacterized membrane protein (GlpM family)
MHRRVIHPNLAVLFIPKRVILVNASSSRRNKAALVLLPLFPVYRMRRAAQYIMGHKRNLERDNELIATSVCLLDNHLTTITRQPRHN